MSAKIIDGKAIANSINAQSAQLVKVLQEKFSVTPGLAVVLVGDDPASQVYVRTKENKCKELGINSRKIVLPAATTMAELLGVINQLNNDDDIDGILVQSPPPEHIDEEKIIAAISPAKDVDCFHAENVGKMLIGRRDGFLPCTPYGVMKLLEYSNIDPAGKHVVIVGRSNIVGKPLMALMVQKAKWANATVSCVHSGTPDIARFTRDADILIAAVGRPEFISGDMVKPGAVVIDVGINRVPNPNGGKDKLTGDVNFAEVSAIASFITPVPGGVGPMTIAMLMRNAIEGAVRRRNLDCKI
ncbi:MAG: bifunctional methylenetetrahydrofolate dehydrogenase/methenyltetrahydrofolate cyclohydrolase FolD [Lentisphaeria bacterium]|nr:bifunctional methylenetetrahydrofolate dehydrogenase/methenyltetrahydrofolate cyclohydrolase FolD [Lentisphaeria bacterium]